MNDRTKRFALAALCLALIVALFWQRTRMQRLIAENAELRTKLAAAQIDRPRERPAPAAQASPDPELLRLRAEIAELRRQKAEVARSNSSPRVAQSTGANESSELPFEMRQLQGSQVLKRLVLAMHVIMVDRAKGDGRLEIVGPNGELTPEMRREIEKLLSEGEETTGINLDNAWPDIELLITDGGEIRKLDPNTVVARTVPMKMPNGKWMRVYAIADGSAHRRVHDTPEEVWQAPAP